MEMHYLQQAKSTKVIKKLFACIHSINKKFQTHIKIQQQKNLKIIKINKRKSNQGLLKITIYDFSNMII